MSRPSNQLPNLDKLFKDDDDQDFAPIAGSSLAAIFGTPQKHGRNSQSGNKLSSQKKSTSGRNTPQKVQPTIKTEVIIAKVVHAYKLKSRQYTLVGKLGIALIGNASTRIYQIILYANNQEHVSTVTLTPEFSWTILENNYATYYDGSNENWSLVFEDENSRVEFAREIGISRYLSRRTRTDDSVFHQNLTVDSKEIIAKENDEINLKYTLCTNLDQPLKFDGSAPQNMNVKISPYDNWERSLIDCSKGLKRLMILPSSKQISLGPGFPKEREIIMEIEIIDIIKSEDKSLPVDKSQTTSGKAMLLSRMAKMGQSMLSKAETSTPTDSEDTEEEFPVKSPRRFKPEVSALHPSKNPPRGFQESPQDTVDNNFVPRTVIPTTVPLQQRPVLPSPVFASPWPTGSMQQQYVTIDGQYYPIQQAPSTQPLPVAIDPNLNLVLSEMRTHNTEVRMALAKISDNVQKLLDKFHILEVQNASSPLIHRRLFNSSNGEMLTSGKRCAGGEFGNELLDKNSMKLAASNEERQRWGKEKSDLWEKLEILKKSLEESQNALEIANIRQRLKQNPSQETSISKSNDDNVSPSKSSSSLVDSTISVDQKIADLKRLMNDTYRTLLLNFTREEIYTAKYMQETLDDITRAITFPILNEFQQETTEIENSETISDSIKSEDEPRTINTIPKIPDAQEPPPVPPMDEDVIRSEAT